MNRLNVLFVMLLPFAIVSCSKQKDDVVQPQNETKTSNVPHFDETNSTAITWDQLPAELRNAIPVENKETGKDENTSLQTSNSESSSFSYYRYSVGPWGGSGGTSYYIHPPSGSRIYAMAIRSGSLVDRLTIWYVTSSGTIYVGGDRGGSGGTYHLQYFSSDEYIYAAGGRSGGFLDRISIYTNRKSFSYGGNGGSAFSASVPSGYQILGFWGGSGRYIDRIGFYVYTR